jgi:hypothetical protein
MKLYYFLAALSLLVLSAEASRHSSKSEGSKGRGKKKCQENMLTSSARAVMLPGTISTSAEIELPDCTSPPGSKFLVKGVHVGPEIMIGNTRNDVVELDHWGVSVPVYQLHQYGSTKVSFTLIGNGPQALSGELPAGQATDTADLPVHIELLGVSTNDIRYEFNIHIWGSCGHPFIQGAATEENTTNGS